MNSRLLSTLPFLLIAMLAAISPYLWGAEDYPQDTPEPQVKATYIIKFEKYTTWPPNAIPSGMPVVIGIVGAAAVAQELESWAENRIGGKRQIQVRRLQTGDSLQGIHILFIGGDKTEEAPDWLLRVDGKPILCVTETETGMPTGSMINFVHDSGRLRFDVSPNAAEHNGIKLSAALLTVARQVQRGKT